MRFLDSQWPKHAFQFGGGGFSVGRFLDPAGITPLGKGKPGSFLDPANLFGKKGGSPADAINAAPVPMPAAPVTSDNMSVVQAEHDLARQALGKKSVKRTIFAGDTGGWGGGQSVGAPGSPAPKGKF